MRRPYVLVLALSAFIVSRWFRTGTFIATGDMGPFIRTGWAPEATWSWNHQVTGAGSASYVVARGFEFVLIWCAKAVGLGEYTAQWMFYTCIYSLVGFGMAYVAAAFVRSEIAIVAAGAFGVLNGFFLTRLPNPLNIISVGSIALLTGVAIRVAQGRRIPAPVAGLVLLPTSFLAFNPPMLLVAYAWAVAGTPMLALLVCGRRAALRLLLWLARAAPWAVALNCWWLVPLAQSYLGGGGAAANVAFTDPSSWSWSQVNNLPQNILTMVANWAWFRPQYLPFASDLDRPGWVWIRYLLPAIVFLAPAVALRAQRRLALWLLGLVICFVVLAKGLRPPFIWFNTLLYAHIPGFWLFREPMSKLGQLLVLLFAILLAVYVEAMVGVVGPSWIARWHRLHPRVLRIAGQGAALAPVLLVLAYPYPLITGSVIPDERPTQPSAHVRVPQEWWDAAGFIDQDPRPGKVLVLPLDDYYQMPTTWGFFGVDSIANLLIQHPVIQRHPDGYFGDSPGFTANVVAVETALLAGDVTAVPRLLDALGVSEVIVRHDLIRGMPNRSFADDRILTAAMGRVEGARRVRTGMIEVWQIDDGSSPTVRTYQRLLDAPARPNAGAAIIGSLPTTTAIAAREDTSGAATSPRVDDTPAATGDAVAWPVPAVDEGVPATTVDLPAGRYTVAQRARAAAVLTPVVDRKAGTLVLRDPSVVVLDGAPVSRRGDVTIDLPEREILAIRTDTRAVSLDGWGLDRLPNHPAAPTVTVGAATRVALLAASTQPADLSPYSQVADCNNYEPRPPVDLGLSGEVEESEEGTLLRLAAADHAACATAVVRDAQPGRTYRIRLEYRSVQGARPQICLMQTGTDLCELTPRSQASQEWTPFERILTIGTTATGLTIVLHADVGERFKEPTITEYRGLTVQALDAVAEETVWPPAPEETQVDLAAGQHELRVNGGLAGSVLSGFEELEDCFRYDDRSIDEAGLFLEVTTDEQGETTYALGAASHLACIASSAPDFGASSLYELSMEARSVAVRTPKFCVYLRGPDRCMTVPTVAAWEDWTTYEALIQPDPAAVETRLYLYGLRDLKGERRSEVEYRGVRLRPVASPTTVVLLREPSAPEAATSGAGASDAGAATVSWRRENPTRFAATVTTAGPTVLALAESHAPGWRASAAGASHLAVQGWMNGWLLDSGGPVTLSYAPAGLSRTALFLLPVAVLAAGAAIAVSLRWPQAGRRLGRWLLRAPPRAVAWVRAFARAVRRIPRHAPHERIPIPLSSLPPGQEPPAGGRNRRPFTIILSVAVPLVLVLAVGATVLGVLHDRGATVRVVAAGDMACDPDDPNFLARSDAEGDFCRQDDVSDLAVRLDPDLVLGLGDYQYEVPTTDAYQDVYGPSWGRLASITIPVFGNQEFKASEAYPFRAYFGDRIVDERGYWSQDAGAWHLVVLNSNCTIVEGGCAAGSPQQRWLARDLDRTDRRCVLAAWHHPRWSSGIAGPDDRTADLFATLYEHRVEAVLSGHEAHYERFDPLDPEGTPDPDGVRQFVVGVGGQAHYDPVEAGIPERPSGAVPASAHVDYAHHGLLELQLEEGSLVWRFRALRSDTPDRLGTVEDHGALTCR